MGRNHVSWSEIQTWCACRLKWRWAYEVGIVLKRVVRAPMIGSCGHKAIAAALRGEDWKKAAMVWLKEELAKREMFEEEQQELREMADLIIAIIPRYLDEYNDKFTPILIEQKFEIPIRGVKVKMVGYWDSIVKDSDKKLWLMEHKFPQRQFRTDMDLELDGQIGIYQWAAHRLGYPVVGTIYNQLMAQIPSIPSINNNGSISRAACHTDWVTYSKTVTEQGLNLIDYMEMKEKLADVKFFQRNYVFRPMKEVRLFARDMEHRVWDMLRTKKHIYRSESHMTCGFCPYRELCIESLKGGDIDYIIEDQFEKKQNRKEEKNERKTNPTIR